MAAHRLRLFVLTALLAPRIGMGASADAVEDGRRCLTCHKATAAEHLKDWDRSVHARAGVLCTSCHIVGAPGTAIAPQKPLGGALKAVATCGHCHREIATAFGASRHALAVGDGRVGPTCSDCHTTAGGNALPPERFAERCGRCHSGETAKGELAMARRAIDVLGLLRRVTLARALMTEPIDRRRRRGLDVSAYDEALTRVDAVMHDLGEEWHRFDFAVVEKRCLAVLHDLEALYARVQEEP